MVGETVERAAADVGVIVVGVARVHDLVLAHAGRDAFEETQLTQQDGVIGDAHRSARPQRQTFEIGLGGGEHLRHALATHSRAYLSPVTPEQRYSLHNVAYSRVSSSGSKGPARPRTTSR